MVSDFLKDEISKALAQIGTGGEFAVSPEKRFGDYTTNAGLVAAASSGKSPREMAEAIIAELSKSENFKKTVSKTEIAGPGFINFYLSDGALKEELGTLADDLINGFDITPGKNINIEFISANPTGELHIGHGRGAFYGDALANILSFAGARVVREFYINDSRESKQIIELGKTALGTGEQYKTPELAEMMKGEDFSGLSESEAGFKLAGKVQKNNQEFIESKLGVHFDNWYSEDEKLRATEVNQKTLELLKEKNLTHEKDGAVWLKTSAYGDDEDRVIVRSDGSFSYFLSDIAYHSDKFARENGEVIDIWGADHHGHVKRIMAAKKMLDWDGELNIFITQLVSLRENGVSSKMSKRAGNVVLLKDLVEEFGSDVVRWFFLDKSLNTHMEFDMALAKEQSAKNPVFYVQYAHARICSVLEKAKKVSSDGSKMEEAIREKSGRALAVKLMEFPEIISAITDDCSVHKLNTYVYELASVFSKFYDLVRIVGESSYNSGALALVQTTKDTLAKSLGLLGISAPEKM